MQKTSEWSKSVHGPKKRRLICSEWEWCCLLRKPNAWFMLCGTLTMGEQNHPLPPSTTTTTTQHSHIHNFIYSREVCWARKALLRLHTCSHLGAAKCLDSLLTVGSRAAAALQQLRSRDVGFFQTVPLHLKYSWHNCLCLRIATFFPYCRVTALHVRTVKSALQPFQLETTQVRSWRPFSWSVIINYIHKFISVYKFYISGVYPHLNQRSEARRCYSL